MLIYFTKELGCEVRLFFLSFIPTGWHRNFTETKAEKDL